MTLSEWPVEFRPILHELKLQRKYTNLHMLEDISGASGAKTYLAAPQTQHGTGNILILKLGSKIILDRDREGLETAKDHFSKANLDLQDAIELEGICCIPMELVGATTGEGAKGGQSFAKFYINSQDSNAIVSIIQKLFIEILRRDEMTLKPQHKNAFHLYDFENPAVMSRELRRIGDTLPTFTYWWEKAREECTNGSFLLMQHGDLHSKNVIAIETKEPRVIDFGLTGSLHVMRDIAKFEREIRLFLYLHDSSNLLEDYKALNSALLTDEEDEIRKGNPSLQKACCAIEGLHKLASESLRGETDWRFEYYSALLAQFIFAASNPRIEIKIRKIALESARDLRQKLAEEFEFYVNVDEEAHVQKLRGVLWRIAYTFFRLDQLPSGGWSKTLPKWMEALWEGDAGKIERNSGMRTKGGTDLTCYAFYNYCTFLDSISPGLELSFRSQNSVANIFRRNFHERIGFDGGVGVGRSVRGESEAVPIRIRHTTMAVIAFLMYGKNEAAPPALDDLKLMMGYLVKYLEQWKVDSSHYFGTYAGLVKLLYLLSDDETVRQLSPPHLKNLASQLNTLICNVLPTISVQLLSSFEYTTRPEGLFDIPISPLPSFEPYQRFWRMKRSNFLMHFPLLLKRDGTDFVEQVDEMIRVRCKSSLREMMNDIETPFDIENPIASLICYQDPCGSEHLRNDPPQKDWGLSAELAAILEFPITQNLLNSANDPSMNEKKEALCSALLHTFNGYYIYPEIFKFTHGVSFGRYLNTVVEHVDSIELKDLDRDITELVKRGVTEKDLKELVDSIFDSVQVEPDELDSRSIITMLVDNLESGEHTPDPVYCKDHIWNERVSDAVNNSTISFYDDEMGSKYCNRYQQNPVSEFVNRIGDIQEWEKFELRKALDVGCGPGQYANLLREKGFEVQLLDASKNMLKEASKLLGIDEPSPKNIYDLDKHFPNNAEFDLIFACATMIHVPKGEARGIFNSFYRLLKPGGVLFVNFKIGDHSLICEGGRFFEYYRDFATPLSIIESVGFKRETIFFKWNRKNRYEDPVNIHWANYYFTK